MAYQQKELSGSIFKNDRKQKENQPDFKGSALIDGVEYWISGWDKGKFTSLSFSKKQASANNAPTDKYANSDFAKSSKHLEEKANGYQPEPDILDDTIPF